MVRVLPLGGLGEVGMNCLAIEQRGEVVLVDCGVTFPDRGLGVDVIHPDFSPLDRFGERLLGVLVTHGHEDHIGALPYLLAKHDVPVYGPKYALGLVSERLGEHEVLAHARLYPTSPREKFRLGSFEVEPVRVTHSIADATALAITTDEGVIVHTGDFKFDESPPDNETFDEARLRELGDAGVTLLFSDSTNADVEGPTGSEVGVGTALETIVQAAQGVVVVAMFASNVHRLRLLGEIAERTGRKIVLLGRGVGTHARVARATGYLPWPDALVLPEALARETPRSKLLVIATGSQGEERAALARLARDDHASLKLAPGDTVILSARAIPGNEPDVQGLMNLFLRRGIDVRTRATDRGIHVSGHAHRPDQRRMLSLVRPKCFIPVHGTIHHLTRHAELAREAAVPDVAVIENGRVAEIAGDRIALGPVLPAGRVHVWAGMEITKPVLRERAALAAEGAAFATVTVDALGTATDVVLTTRGVLDPALGAAEMEEVRAAVRRAIAEAHDGATEESLAEAARLAIRRTFVKNRGIKPITVVHVSSAHARKI